ncbi:hypothetical protein SSX86_029853 [Deinandra increscens subsp. villosa]|uniref:Glucose-methanol-choline oxidoreductase N-terminal domain-containing protein n=1 Tax=Deinandra increscens subsp. villosa TaxID=3103831 RepID=A0AAP0GKZ3_9ASTR
MEFVVNSIQLPAEDTSDYIIVGGSTAGCPLAATLSKNFRVLVLERGGLPSANPNVMTRPNSHALRPTGVHGASLHFQRRPPLTPESIAVQKKISTYNLKSIGTCVLCIVRMNGLRKLSCSNRSCRRDNQRLVMGY